MRPWRLMVDQYEGNPDPDLAAYRNAGHLRYMHKATEGAYHVDSKHRERVTAAHDLGLFVNHYHFCRPGEAAGYWAEMELFWATCKPLYRPGDRLCLDYEQVTPAGGVIAQDYLPRTWQHLLRISGVKATIYGSSTFLAAHVPVAWLRERDRHEAAYGPPPTDRPWGTHWWAWQFTDGTSGPWRHPVAGIGLGDQSMLSIRAGLRDLAGWRRRRQLVKGKAGK